MHLRHGMAVVNLTLGSRRSTHALNVAGQNPPLQFDVAQADKHHQAFVPATAARFHHDANSLASCQAWRKEDRSATDLAD